MIKFTYRATLGDGNTYDLPPEGYTAGNGRKVIQKGEFSLCLDTGAVTRSGGAVTFLTPEATAFLNETTAALAACKVDSVATFKSAMKGHHVRQCGDALSADVLVLGIVVITVTGSLSLRTFTVSMHSRSGYHVTGRTASAAAQYVGEITAALTSGGWWVQA